MRDFRRVIEDKNIDTVVIAAPDHWHALMTIMACEVGKDVFVEKPASRTIVEGRRMVQAARFKGKVDTHVAGLKIDDGVIITRWTYRRRILVQLKRS